jgi:hypothetical protein
VKKTLVTPAKLPLNSLRIGVSCAGEWMIAERICSYARNLMAAYGKIRSKVAECPRKSPRVPSSRYMSFIAVITPNELPAYFANWGFEAWKRILTRSRGATNVLACLIHCQ